MVMTRDQKRNAYNHVLDNVLSKGDGSALKLSLEEAGFDDILILLSLREEDIEELEYPNPLYDADDINSNSMIPLRKADKRLLAAFLAYDAYLNDTGNLNIDYMLITQGDFDNFRISPHFKHQVRPPANNAGVVLGPNVVDSTPSQPHNLTSSAE